MSQSLHTAVCEPRRLDGGRSPLVLLLHGYGSDEADLLGLAEYLDPRCRVISARAPLQLPMGGNAWFPLDMTDEGIRPDFAAADSSLQQLSELLTQIQQTAGNDGQDTVILGFSQGGAMAIALLLERAADIAGVAFLSGLWSRDRMPVTPPNGVGGTPVLQTHGRMDPVIPIDAARDSQQMLQELGVDLTYREYDMAHQINAECLRDVSVWLTERFE